MTNDSSLQKVNQNSPFEICICRTHHMRIIPCVYVCPYLVTLYYSATEVERETLFAPVKSMIATYISTGASRKEAWMLSLIIRITNYIGCNMLHGTFNQIAKHTKKWFFGRRCAQTVASSKLHRMFFLTIRAWATWLQSGRGAHRATASGIFPHMFAI